MATNTTNLILEKPAATDNVDISVINSNMDIIDASIGSKSSLQTTEKGNLVGAINELFQSASNGKDAIKSAITGVDSKVSVPTNPTFQQLATAITQINTGKKYLSGQIIANGNNTLNISHSTIYKPNIVIASSVDNVTFTVALRQFGTAKAIWANGTNAGQVNINTNLGDYSSSLYVYDQAKTYNWIVIE